jgi:hypothetical protein
VLEGLLAWGRTYAVSPADPDLERRRWAPLSDDPTDDLSDDLIEETP